MKCECCKAGVHPDPKEAEAVRNIFEKYATGSSSLRELAGWLNDQGFRTKNTKRFIGTDGTISTGPRRFTIASVRWLLHNPFFTGKVTYKGEEHAGLHESLIQESLFQTVQDRLKHARGRSHEVCAKYRFYTLKGIARCVYCGLPLWAETTKKGNAYYREQSGTRAYDGCPAQGKVVRCDFVDEQIAILMQNITLRPTWKKQILSHLASESEYVSVTRERQHVQERLRRLGKAFVDNLISENEYEMEKRVLEAKLNAPCRS